MWFDQEWNLKIHFFKWYIFLVPCVIVAVSGAPRDGCECLCNTATWSLSSLMPCSDTGNQRQLA